MPIPCPPGHTQLRTNEVQVWVSGEPPVSAVTIEAERKEYGFLLFLWQVEEAT